MLKQQVPRHNFSRSASPRVIPKFRDSSKWKSALKCSWVLEGDDLRSDSPVFVQ